MRIGIFTDTYFPQVSGVATSIKTLKETLETMGHEVYIFTTTDPHSNDSDDPTIIRLPSVPFISFTDRRIVMRGLFHANSIAKKHKLDIIHIQTEFGVGYLGKFVASQLDIPVIHTLHTKYEDYVHYIAKGHLIHPGMVKYMMKVFLYKMDGLICPSAMVAETVDGYGIKIPRRIIPTGIELDKFNRPDITEEKVKEFREKLGISEDETMLLSISRISYEKNIQKVIEAMPDVIREVPVKLIVVGDGPYREDLEKLVEKLNIGDYVSFMGMVPSDETAYYYHAADFTISASTSETQGLTYIESLASATPIIASNNSYLRGLVSNKMFGSLFDEDQNLAQVTIDAVKNTPQMNQELLSDKLYEISAENFGEKVYEFYLDTTISYKFNGKIKDESLSEMVLKSPITIIKGVARTPKQVAKFAKKAGGLLKKQPENSNEIWTDFDED
ncbi:glycosyltransferase family 4 protein [Streptococcaceae bacterium ESL0687]|nr:glycosyltransferase family 4 protein [Streptococcaceae bacterium ESL0687]